MSDPLVMAIIECRIQIIEKADEDDVIWGFMLSFNQTAVTCSGIAAWF